MEQSKMYELTMCISFKVTNKKLKTNALTELIQAQLPSLKAKYKDVVFADLIKNLKIASVGDNSVVMTSAVTVTDIPSAIDVEVVKYQLFRANFRDIKGRNLLEKSLKNAEITHQSLSVQ